MKRSSCQDREKNKRTRKATTPTDSSVHRSQLKRSQKPTQPSRSTPLVTPPTAKVAQRQKGKQRKAKRLDIPRWMAARKTALISVQRRWSWHRSGAQRTETPSV
ncbi:hypothetical protein NC652_029132 [Populus alba x Populus x berolinensis]|nr:hypothetical protein NC652_029127 [Populus alba x Populus x berolinensis]KAJ6888027.1 hypothetical protein NC652_029132 [Populus alba x Populus x berolinensis]